MPQLPQGYAGLGSWPKRNPQPPVAAPKPLPPQGSGGRVIGAPQTNTPTQAPLVLQPVIKIIHSIFGG